MSPYFNLPCITYNNNNNNVSMYDVCITLSLAVFFSCPESVREEERSSRRDVVAAVVARRRNNYCPATHANKTK